MEEELLRFLKNIGLAEIRFFESIDSTNSYALNWLENGAQDFSLVTADLQTAGRGRLGRRWVTRSGSALAFSLLIHPQPCEMEHLSLFPLLSALAVCRALEEGYGLHPQVKWPNDVLWERQKICGILLEAAWLEQNLQGLVIGIGLNVTRESLPPASELLFPAACVEQAVGQTVERWNLLAKILQQWINWRKHLGTEAFFQAYHERLAFCAEEVRVERLNGESLEGLVRGVTHTGDLRLRTSDGYEYTLSAGDVHVRPVRV